MPGVQKIRFVGGPFHNELRVIPENRRVVFYPLPQAVEFGFSILDGGFQMSSYCRRSFFTEFGTHFEQMIDASLDSPDGPLPCTYSESFPPFEVCEKEMLRCLKSK